MNLYGVGSGAAGAADVQPLPVQLPFAPGQPGLCDSKSFLPVAKASDIKYADLDQSPLTAA
jgi:hypothetical protein